MGASRDVKVCNKKDGSPWATEKAIPLDHLEDSKKHVNKDSTGDNPFENAPKQGPIEVQNIAPIGPDNNNQNEVTHLNGEVGAIGDSPLNDKGISGSSMSFNVAQRLGEVGASCGINKGKAGRKVQKKSCQNRVLTGNQ
ncbi:hypothetical protein L1887_35685 [Cichorium endivia]|nr:hypothetical protein L1887_35685 [Cichorium endivia]